MSQSADEYRISDERVMAAMRAVPRREFVPEEYGHLAGAERPLSIGHGQTISQPTMVRVMTELLQLRVDDRVLEVGTGSGYQAAILSLLVREVYSVEIIPALCAQAQERLSRLGYANVRVRCGDGYYGWPEYAPYRAIIVTSAPDHVPAPLVAQLADGGRMVVPVGPANRPQVLYLVQRSGEEVSYRRLMDVAFVPLTGERRDPPLADQ